MGHVFVAVATSITTTGSYEDCDTEVETTVVAVDGDETVARQALLTWAKANVNDDTEVRLAITAANPVTGTLVSTSTFAAVPTVELVVSDPSA